MPLKSSIWTNLIALYFVQNFSVMKDIDASWYRQMRQSNRLPDHCLYTNLMLWPPLPTGVCNSLFCPDIYLKAVPQHTHRGSGGRGGIAPTHSRPRHQMGGEWSASRPGRALPPGKGPPVPIGEEAGWAPELVWTRKIEEKSSCL
jgi:hypothetical protein